jgi:hypothetical protein
MPTQADLTPEELAAQEDAAWAEHRRRGALAERVLIGQYATGEPVYFVANNDAITGDVGPAEAHLHRDDIRPRSIFDDSGDVIR